MHRLLSLSACVALSPFGCGKDREVVTVVVDAEPSDGGGEGETEAGVTLEGVHWTADWDDTGLELLDGGGWRLERSDGAALEVTEGWLVVYRMVLEPCTDPTARTPPPHGYFDHPSGSPEAVAMALHDLEPADLGTASFDAQAFCATWVTLFQGTEGDPGMPGDGVMEGLTLRLTGQLRRGPDAEWEPIEMETYLSAEDDLVLEGSDAWSGATTGQVEVVFRPAAMLDDIDLEQDPDRIALYAIGNLSSTARTTLSAVP